MDLTMTTSAQLPIIIQVHTGAAVLVLLTGPCALWRARRGHLHRIAGSAWIVLMLIVATSAWFIHSIRLFGPFSPIHLFALLTYWSLFVALRHVRAGRYKAHGAAMRALYLQALGIAGVFTLLPGWAMHHILFGDQVALGGVVMITGGGLIVALLRRTPRLRIVR